MKSLLIICIVLVIFANCSGVATLGTKSHIFASKAKHIVWIQVEGLTPEHFVLTSFDDQSSEKQLQNFSCLGTMWNYNLFKLRPTGPEGFMSQALGSKNIKKQCRDIDRDPVWSFFQRVGYSAGLFYSGKEKSKKFDYQSCKEIESFTKNSWVWRRQKKTSDRPYFHFQEKMMTSTPQTMFDKSCQQKGCEVPFAKHAFYAWKEFSSRNERTFFVVRDSRFKNLIIKKNLLEAKKRLNELLTLSDLIKKENKKGSISVVMSSSGALKVDFPKKGKPWMMMEKGKRQNRYKSSSLNSYVWSFGPGTENFCGTFNESEMLKRFLWLPEGSFVEDFIQ